MTRDEIRKKWKNGEMIGQRQEEQAAAEPKKQELKLPTKADVKQESMWDKVKTKFAEHLDKFSGGHMQEKFKGATPNTINNVRAREDAASASRYNKYGVGNIDLTNRKVVKNEDGSISTEKSFSFYDDKEKKEILVPTIIDGKEVSEKEAAEHYYKTGEYLGKFDTPEEADKYAEELHEKQDKRYGEPKGLLNGWVDKGAFNDGYQFGDLTKTELATGLDLTKRAFKGGITNVSKALSDIGVITSAAYKRYLKGDEEGADRLLNTSYQNGDLPEKVADGIFGAAGTFVQYLTPQKKKEFLLEVGKAILQGDNAVDSVKNKLLGDFREASDYFNNLEKDSILGNKSGQLAESVAQNARQRFLQEKLKIPWQLQTTLETVPETYLQKRVGEQMSEGKSVLSAVTDAANEIFWENVFDGIEFKGTGGTTIDNFLNGQINTINNPATRAIMKNFKRILGEGFEESGGDYTGNLKELIIRGFPEGEELTKENLLNYLKSLPANALMNIMETTEDEQTWEDFLMGSLSVVGQDVSSAGRPVVNQFRQERYVQPIIENQNLNQKEKNTIIEAMTGEAPENVKKNQKESEKIAETIENSNLTDEEKNVIAREITNNGYNLNSYRETVLNRLVSENQATTMENKPVSEQEQQTMPQQPKLPEKAISQELSEDDKIQQRFNQMLERERQKAKNFDATDSKNHTNDVMYDYNIYDIKNEIGEERFNKFRNEHESDFDDWQNQAVETQKQNGTLNSGIYNIDDNLVKLTTTREGNKLYIDELYVEKKNQGTGTKVIDMLKEYADKAGLTIETSDELEQAKGFWDKVLNRNIVDINQENGYNNLSDEEIENEFRRIQEESRGKSYDSIKQQGESTINNEGLRERLSGVFERELERRGYNASSNKSLSLKSDKGTTFDMYEDVDAETFHDIFEVAKKYTENGELVDLHEIKSNPDEGEIGYEDTKNYISKDGLSGFAITKDGDLISVFNASNKKGFLSSIADIVKKNAKTLDCYASPNQNLQEMYQKKFGFKTAAIMDYNMEYDHDNIAANHNKPQVAFMVNTDQNVETKHFNENQYNEALEYRDKFINNEGTQEEGSFLVSENAEAKLPERPSLIKASEVNKQNTETTDENLEAIREANILNEPENQKVKKRQYNQSVKESDFVSEEAKKKFHEAFGDPTYIVKGNKEMISKMADEIDKYGIEESYNDFVKTFEENTRRMTVEDLIKGQLLMRYYSYAGEIGTEKFNRLDLDLGMLGTELGQAVQSLSIINRDTPETRLKMLDTAMKRLSKENNDANLLISEETKQAIRDAGDNKELLDERMNEAFKEIANQLPRTWLDTMDSWRYLSMLGNPVTLIRNETGNFGNHWLMGAKKIVSGALQDLYGGTQNLLVKAGIKNENTFEKTATFKPANKDQRTFAQQDAELMGENIDSGQGNKYNDNTKSEIEKQRDAFNSRLANYWNEKTMTTLDKRDTAYLKWAYKDALQNYMSANNLSSEDFKTDYSVDTGDVEQDRINKQQNEINAEKLEKARDYASRYACEATFHQFSAVAKAVNKFRASLNETIKSNDPNIKKGASLLTKIGMDSTLPFVRTTFNMGAQSLEFSPLGLYLSAGKMVHAATLGNQKLTQQYDNKVSGYATKFANNEITREVFDQKMEQAKTELNQKKSQMANNVIESAAKGLTGTAISLIAMAMTKSGMIKVRATDDDKDEKKIKNFLNIPEYSIQFGDTAIPIDWLAPVSIPFVIGMYMGKALEDDEDMSTLDKIMTASNASIKGSVGAVTNLSFMEGLLNAFRSYSSEATDNLESFVSNVASGYINQYIPTVVRKVNKTFNPRIQDTTSTKKGTIGRTMEKTWKNVKAGLPIGEAYGAIKDVTGLRLPEAVDNFLEANPTRVDYKGDETSYDEKGVTSLLTKQFGDSTGIKVVGRLLDNFALPTSPSLIRNDEYSKELVKIAEATDDAGVIPDITSLDKDVSINKEKYRMGDREYNEAQKIYGKVSSDLISTLMKTEGYNKLSDTQKAELIKNIYSYAREEVKADYAKDHDLEFESSTTPAIKDMYNTINKIKTAGGKAEDYINYLVGAQNLTNKEERLRLLNSMNIKQSSKDAIYANDVATYVSYSEGKDSNYDALQVLNGGKARQGYLDYKQKSAENYFTNTDEKTGKSITGQKQQRVRDFLQNSDLSDIEKYYIYAKEGYACVKRGGGLTKAQRQKLRDALNNNKLNIDEETYNSMIKTLDEADANAKKWGINN